MSVEQVLRTMSNGNYEALLICIKIFLSGEDQVTPLYMADYFSLGVRRLRVLDEDGIRGRKICRMFKQARWEDYKQMIEFFNSREE